MNLAPLLAELAGLRALPTGLLRPQQEARLNVVRSALSLAQHVLPGSRDELPRVRLAIEGSVLEGSVIGCGCGSLQLRILSGAAPVRSIAALLHFADGRPPRALMADLRPGPIEGYWNLEALDGMLDDADRVCERSERLESRDAAAISL